MCVVNTSSCQCRMATARSSSAVFPLLHCSLSSAQWPEWFCPHPRHPPRPPSPRHGCHSPAPALQGLPSHPRCSPALPDAPTTLSSPHWPRHAPQPAGEASPPLGLSVDIRVSVGISTITLQPLRPPIHPSTLFPLCPPSHFGPWAPCKQEYLFCFLFYHIPDNLAH